MQEESVKSLSTLIDDYKRKWERKQEEFAQELWTSVKGYETKWNDARINDDPAVLKVASREILERVKADLECLKRYRYENGIIRASGRSDALDGVEEYLETLRAVMTRIT